MGSYCTRGTSKALITCTGSVRREVPQRALMTACACSLVSLVDEAPSALGQELVLHGLLVLRTQMHALSSLTVLLQPLGTGSLQVRGHQAPMTGHG